MEIIPTRRDQTEERKNGDRTMLKRDIETHGTHLCGPELPAINIKLYRGPGTRPPDTDDVTERFLCDRKTAERALEFWFQSAQEQFWEQATEAAADVFGSRATVYSAGRSGGWLVVQGLAPLESWDAVAVARWARFAKIIRADIAYRCAAEQVYEDIDANQWTKPGAELYNFLDRGDGSTVCIADLKREARDAGFGPIMR